MASVETIGKIRRAWHVHGRSICSIAKSMGVSRNTVRKVLRSDGSAPKYRRSEQPSWKDRPGSESVARSELFVQRNVMIGQGASPGQLKARPPALPRGTRTRQAPAEPAGESNEPKDLRGHEVVAS